MVSTLSTSRISGHFIRGIYRPTLEFNFSRDYAEVVVADAENEWIYVILYSG
jgi:hypothetical protein